MAMWIVTDVAAKMLGISSSKVAELCRSGKIFANKRKDEASPFPYWHIELQSLAYHLRYNREAMDIFTKGDDSVLKRKLTAMLNNIQSSETRTYSFNETCTILGLTKMELTKKCFSGKLGRHHLLYRSFTLTDILIYIKHTPKAEEQLQERYENALMNGDGRLLLYREVATAYAYYKQYGYAI